MEKKNLNSILVLRSKNSTIYTVNPCIKSVGKIYCKVPPKLSHLKALVLTLTNHSKISKQNFFLGVGLCVCKGLRYGMAIKKSKNLKLILKIMQYLNSNIIKKKKSQKSSQLKWRADSVSAQISIWKIYSMMRNGTRTSKKNVRYR